MRIIDALKNSGAPFDIPDANREDLPQFFVDMGFKVGAEIGTAKGVFAEKICQVGLKLYCIDPWRAYDDYYPGEEGQKSLNEQYKQAKKRLKGYDCKLIRKDSLEALSKFENESLDFVYIDGNHEFRYIADDLWEWGKKVKKGGVIAGHDYFYAHPRVSDNIHVKYVLDAFVRCMKIRQWYVIGRKEKIKGEKRDFARSFFWIKN